MIDFMIRIPSAAEDCSEEEAEGGLFFLNALNTGIILGTHREKGAYTFWSYALGFPLASNSILSWKFCHVLHKVLRDGHRNASSPPPPN